MPNSAYDLGLTFRSVFTQGDQYNPKSIDLPPHFTNDLYQLVDLSFKKSLVQQVEDSVVGIVNLDLSAISPELLTTINNALTDQSAAAQVTDATAGKNYGIPVTNLTGYMDLPGEYSILICMDQRNAVSGYGFQVSKRIILKDMTIDFTAIYANPGR